MRRCFPLVLMALACALGASAAEQEHVVPPAELEQSLEAAAETRRHNEAAIRRLIDNEDVQEAAEAAGIDPEQVRQAIPQLDDETLAELAVRANALEEDVAGGVFGGIILMLLLILLLAVLISVYVLGD